MTGEGGLRTQDLALGIGLAALSGGAIVAHAFGGVPMTMTVPFLVIPGSSLLVGAVFLGRRQAGRMHEFSDRLVVGGVAGLAATFLYDAVRAALAVALFPDFDPFFAHGYFGQMMTGADAVTSGGLVSGWTYHAWNGISFGMMFSLVKPAGHVVWALVWGFALEWAMLAVYPQFVGVRLTNAAFLATSVVGHITWGLTLGYGLVWWNRRTGRWPAA